MLRQETLQKIEDQLNQKYANRPRKPALGAYLEELVWPIIEGDELLRRYGPLLEEFGMEQERIFIKDNRTNRIAELTFRNNVLFCNLDHSDNCVHIGFAWAIPKVYKILHLYGKKPFVKEQKVR